MSFTRDYKESFWYSSLVEFGEEVFVCNRKQYKISQSEIASKLGLSQSEVSRLERGITKPKNVLIAQDLCNAYRLSSSERKKYLDLIAGTPVLDTDIFTSLIDNQIESIAYLNRSGSPKQAIQLAQNLSSWIQSNPTSDSLVPHANAQYARLLLEESAAWWDIVQPSEVKMYTDSLLNKMETIPHSINNSALIYTNVNKGFHAYINGHYDIANQHFTVALSNSDALDNLWKVETLRASLITFGKLKDFNSVLQLEYQANRFIRDDSNKSLEKGYILEGLARAYAEFNTDKALQLFELAKNYVYQARSESNFMNIRFIQLIRSYLGVLSHTDTTRDQLLQLAVPAIEEAEKSGFERHKSQIITVLNF